MKGKNIDKSLIKKNNQTRILKTIFSNMAISRVEVAKELNMSKPSANEHIDHLLNKEIILELGKGAANVRGGRRPILLAPNNKYRYIIALDFNYTKPIVALGNVTGMPIDRFYVDKLHDSSEMYENVSKCIDEMIFRNGISHEKIGAIVISTPGIVNDKTGEIILHPSDEKIQTVNLKSYLTEKYDLPIIMKNDVNMAAIGEAKFFKREDKNNLFYISCGFGIGSAIILNGEIYDGENYSAGEIDYCILSEDERPIEEKVCIGALIESISKSIIDNDIKTSLKPYDMTFSDIVDAYEANEEVVICAVKKISKILAIIINNYIAMLDVNTVIIGGDYIAFKDLIVSEIQNYINSSKLIFKPKVVPSALAYAGGIIGCFEVGTNYVIEKIET